MRHSTVVVHGEQLVIRKLVVVGVVSAEKSYIECLSVMKEVGVVRWLQSKGWVWSQRGVCDNNRVMVEGVGMVIKRRVWLFQVF